jgi:hypothetical protein
MSAPFAALPFNPSAWKFEHVQEVYPDILLIDKAIPLDEWHRRQSNCYAYALGDTTLLLNRISGGTNPGGLSGNPIKESSQVSGNYLVKLCEADGLQLTGDTIAFKAQSRPVALFMRDNEDYHWLRLDKLPDERGAVWSHKFGNHAPQIIKDDNGFPIRDPRDAPLLGCTGREYFFVCFFNVPQTLSISAEALTKYPQCERNLLQHERGMLNSHKAISVPQLG